MAENVGDAMTFWIWTEDTEKLIARSVVRDAEDPTKVNKRAELQVLEEKQIETPKVVGIKDILPNATLPTIDPDHLVGYTFATEHAGLRQRVEVLSKDDDLFHVEYADGNDAHLTYEEIINLLNKETEDGYHLWTFKEILDHRLVKREGKNVMEVEVLWDTGERSWEALNLMKADDPVTISQYVEKKGLIDKPYWKWANRYLKNKKKFLRLSRQVFLSKQKTGPVYKFGVQVPRNTKEALLLDKQNKNELWKEAIAKEMNKIVEFQVFRKSADGKPPPGYKKIPCHMIYDVKFDGRRKARFVAGGHLTDDPGEDAYAGVIAPEAVRLGMFAAVHNNLQVIAADIGNAYLHAKTGEKLYTILGEEYGPLSGIIWIFDKGLYGLRSSGARFHEHLSDILKKMEFKPSQADPDLWFKDCGTHYEYIARYVDDILIFSKEPQELIKCLQVTYSLQGVGVPEYYLGGDFKVVKKSNGIETFTFCAKTFITNVCERIERLMEIVLKSFETPMATGDHPEMDDTGFLNNDEHSKYRMLIGCGQWAITLGRFDVMFSIQTMARFTAAPRQGHITRVLRIFGYMKAYAKYGIIIDVQEKTISQTEDIKVNWEEQYPGAHEELPSNMPKPKGKPANLVIYADADHAHDQLTRRSVTGILLFINSTPIKWYSKRQNTVETSTYGAELVALRIAIDIVVEFRYKLRMMGIPLKGPSQVLCDNKGVVLNTTLPSSTLKKKHNAIAYHRVREAVAAQIVLTLMVKKILQTSSPKQQMGQPSGSI